MINAEALETFISPYYSQKDIMHDLWHIELVTKAVNKILALGNYTVDRDLLVLATAFHGFVYHSEGEIRRWMLNQGYTPEYIDHVIRVAWESQRPEVPETLEGKILHDAHVLEGGRLYLVVKTLITGSLRGQSLSETLSYMKAHCLGTNRCYLPETIPLCQDMNAFAEDFYQELISDIQ